MLHTHLSTIDILNDMEIEYATKEDELINMWRSDLAKPFSDFNRFESEVGLFTQASIQLANLLDPQSDHSLRQQLKKNCASVPQLLSAVVAYEVKTRSSERTLILMIEDIHTFGPAYAVTVAEGFTSNIVSNYSPSVQHVPFTAADIAAYLSNLSVTDSFKPPAQSKSEQKYKKKDNKSQSYCFIHGFGLGHGGHQCKVMIDGNGVLRDGYTYQMLLCTTPGATLIDSHGQARVAKNRST
jgi:hypothetical protein